MNPERIPSCEVVGPDGDPITIHPYRRSDSVGDLAAALKIDPESVTIDGCRVSPNLELLRSPMRIGSTVSVTPVAESPAREPTECLDGASIELAVIAGVACERWRALGPGRHLVGRSIDADVRLDDPSVEIHHGWLDTTSCTDADPVHRSDADAIGRFSQLTGRHPVTVGERPCPGISDVRSGDILRFGASAVAVRSRGAGRPVGSSGSSAGAVGSVVASECVPWRQVVRRGPVDSAPESPRELVVPERPTPDRVPPAVGLVGAGIAAIGAGVMALVLGQMLFAVFAAVAALGSIATWLVGAGAALRSRRRSANTYQRQLRDVSTSLETLHRTVDEQFRRDHPSVIDALEMVHDQAGAVWHRRVTPQRSTTVTVGRGDVTWTAPLAASARSMLTPDLIARLHACETLTDVSAPCVLDPGAAIGIHGDVEMGRALARSIVVQLATFYGPADVRIVVLTRSPERWAWSTWLPHSEAPIDVADVDMDILLTAHSDVGSSVPMTVLVTDSPEVLTVRTGAARRMLAATSAACIVIVPHDQSVPTVCDRTLDIGTTGVARWRDGGRSASGLDVVSATSHLVGISECTAAGAARALAPLIDPEVGEDTRGLVVDVQLHDIGAGDRAASGTAASGGVLSPSSIVDRWKRSSTDPSLSAPIGMTGDGIVDIDLVRDGPHALIAGTTGAGKSELLRTLVVSIAARVSPDHVTFVLVDFKGGSTFDACARLPHTVGVVTDLDGGLAERALLSLEAEITRRERLLRAVDADDLTAYRRSASAPLPRLVVVIDEFASLARELPEFLTSLVGVAQRGRSLGIHLVLATQRPAGVVTDDIRANTSLRLALRLHDRADAIDVVGDEAPAGFPRSVPGRAAMRLGADDLVIFQAASCTGPVPPESGGLRVESHHAARPIDDDDVRHGDRQAATELQAAVEAICMAALDVGIDVPHRPWLEPLPLELRDYAGMGIGLVDDPAHQRWLPLRWDTAGGNLLLVGSLGSGTTTTAVALIGELVESSSPAGTHVYVLDGRGDRAWDAVGLVSHCAAVVRVNEPERLTRLLRRLTATIASRVDTGSRTPQIVLVVDGLGPVRSALSDLDVGELGSLLDRIVSDGPAVGVVTCATTDGSSLNALGMAAGHRWVFRVDDPDVARAVGLAGRAVLPDAPGRLRIVESGLEAQVAFPHPRSVGGMEPRTDADAGGPEAIGVLPPFVEAEWFDRAARPGPAPGDASSGDAAPGPNARADEEGNMLAVGVGANDLGLAFLRVPAGDHILVGGAARTGKSVAVRQLATAWRRRFPQGQVVDVGDVGVAGLVDVDWDAAALAGRSTLVVVDDADRVDDPSGRIAALARRRDPHLTIVAAARLESVRVAYGHWTRDVARSRCGLILTSAGEIDGELLGAVLPRRSMIAPRPGLAWMIDGRGHELVQVAARMRP